MAVDTAVPTVASKAGQLYATLAWNPVGVGLACQCSATPMSPQGTPVPPTGITSMAIGSTGSSTGNVGSYLNGYMTSLQAWAINPVQPPIAAALLYDRLMFFDNFQNINTVDVNNTLQSGFKWYVSHVWPNATNPGNTGGYRNPTGPPTNPNALFLTGITGATMSTSALQIIDDNSFSPPGTGATAYYNYAISSAAYQGPSGLTYQGFAVNAPTGAYISANFAFNIAQAVLGGGYPAFWSRALSSLITSNNTTYVEPDFSRGDVPQSGTGTISPLMNLHD